MAVEEKPRKSAASYWYKLRGGNATVQGPFSAQQLQQLAMDRIVRPDDLVRKEGVEGFHPARKLKGLKFPPPAEQPVKKTNAPGSFDDLSNALNALLERQVAVNSAVAKPSSEYYYKVIGAADATENGPFTWRQFCGLAQNGTLLPKYLIRKVGLTGWRLAGKNKKLVFSSPVMEMAPEMEQQIVFGNFTNTLKRFCRNSFLLRIFVQ